MESPLVYVIITVFIIWASWISITVLKANAKADRSLSNDEVAQKEIASIVHGMKTMTSELKESFKDLVNGVKTEMTSTNHRLDGFIKTEIEELKKIAEK